MPDLFALTNPFAFPTHIKTHFLTGDLSFHRAFTRQRITVGSNLPLPVHYGATLEGTVD